MKTRKKAYIKKKICNRKFLKRGNYKYNYNNIIFIKNIESVMMPNMGYLDFEESKSESEISNYTIEEIKEMLKIDINDFKWDISNDQTKVSLDILNENIDRSLELILGEDYKKSEGIKYLINDVILDLLLDSIEVLDQVNELKKPYYLKQKKLKKNISILDETLLVKNSACDKESYYENLDDIEKNAVKISWKFSKLINIFNLNLIYKTIGKKNRSYLNFERSKKDFFFSIKNKSLTDIRKIVINYRSQYTIFFKIVDVLLISSKGSELSKESNDILSILDLQNLKGINFSLNLYAFNKYSSLFDFNLLERYYYKNVINGNKNRLEVFKRMNQSIKNNIYLHISNISKFKGLGIKYYLMKNRYNFILSAVDVNINDIYNIIFSRVKESLTKYLIQNYESNKNDKDQYKNEYIVLEKLAGIDPYKGIFVNEFNKEQKNFEKPSDILEENTNDTSKERKRKSVKLDNYVGIYKNMRNIE
ncbi:hypothetical protein C3943_21765 [Lysinibacillus sp. B2A1]|nr:hypothetical protein C3943_21765 [Lysinibacillus sp. B2A1]